MTRHPCFICGQNMTVAAHRRLLFSEVDNAQSTAFTVEVGKDCYAKAVTAGAEGITQLRGIGTVRVFQRLEQAKAYKRPA